MSTGRKPTRPAFASNGFSSTPVKSTREKSFLKPSCLDLDVGVLSDEEDTFSLLSPIYHDSFDSDDDLDQSSNGHSSPSRPVSSERCELPKTPSDQMLSSAVQNAASPTLSAWEQWLLNKAKEERINSEKKAEEERLLEEKKRHQEKEHEEKIAVIEEKIQEWLKIKRDQKKQEQLLKLSEEQEATKREQEKQREIEQKAQQKYKEWLQKKNQEKAEQEKKQQEKAALKEEQERERRQKAEEKFRQWLKQANTKNTASPKSPCSSPYGKSYPSPSFYNPIPWKPIHTPPPETINKTADRKAQGQPKGLRTVSRLRDAGSAAQRR